MGFGTLVAGARSITPWLVLAASGVVMTVSATASFAQDEEDDDGPTYLADFVEEFDSFDGLFPLYRNPDDGSVYMKITAAQMGLDVIEVVDDEEDASEDGTSEDGTSEDGASEDDEPDEDTPEYTYEANGAPQPEFIYFVHTIDGEPNLGLFRGQFRENEVFTLHKYYGSIEFHQENTGFYFDPDNQLANAADANLKPAVLATVPIETTSEDGASFLIPVTDLLKGEELARIKPVYPPWYEPPSYALGGINPEKSKILDPSNYPENTEIPVEYVFDNPGGVNWDNWAITDARAISVFVQHSFVAMPENDYEPRRDDFRVGYFLDYVTDQTSASFTPYRDKITRWDLRKADPEAEVSDPVEPITFWIENTTPLEYRDAVREGALAWNIAFEAAGISNAIQVQVQPDDAEWDAGDIRYNVIRWTASPNPPFGGYGPSFTNPRTGQIIGADIMMENIFVTNRLKVQDYFDIPGGSPAGQLRSSWRTDLNHNSPDDTAGARPQFGPARLASAVGAAQHSHQHQHQYCLHAVHMQQNLMAARAVIDVMRLPEAVDTQLVQSAIRELTLHEIGHTLGLNHNMAASSGIDVGALNDPDAVPANSVMDYNAINLAAPGEAQGQFFMSQPGPYDIWAIQYGYTPDTQAAEALLERSTEPALIFGNDADDMRAPGRNIDPRVMIGDLGPDSVTWAAGRIALYDATIPELKARFIDEDTGDGYQDFYTAFRTLVWGKYRAADAVSRWVGGVYQQRSVAGQSGATAPYIPVDRDKQEEALALLGEHMFGVDAFAVDGELLQYLQRQRRGFETTWGVNEDPHYHVMVGMLQWYILEHLLHPNVMNRMSDTQLYGGEYPVAEYIDDLTAYIFDDDISRSVSTIRQNLQVDYTNALIDIATSQSYYYGFNGHNYVSQSAVLASLIDIKGMVSPGLFGHGTDASTSAHREHLLSLLKAAEIGED